MISYWILFKIFASIISILICNKIADGTPKALFILFIILIGIWR